MANKRNERWSLTEYQFIIKTKGSRTSLHFRNAGRVVDPFHMSFEEVELAYQELTRWQNEMERFYKRQRTKLKVAVAKTKFRLFWIMLFNGKYMPKKKKK